MKFVSPLLTQTPAPATLPVSLAEAKAACRIEVGDTDEDSYLTLLIAAATDLLDGVWGYLGQAVLGQQWLGLWPVAPSTSALELPIGPVSTVDLVKYIAAADALAGTLTTIGSGDYRVSKDRWRCLVTPVSGSWPVMADREDALQVTFTAGGVAATKPVKLAICAIVAFWYDNRDGGIADRLPDQMWKMVDNLLVNERNFG